MFQKKKFRFIILQNGIKHHVKFLVKKWLFSILDFGLKRLKNTKEPHETLESNKFCILDGTKHDSENFGILHSVILK
jgi:hypothetical protein